MSGPDDSDLRARLRGLRVDPPDDGFSASLHRRLAAAGPPSVLPFWRRGQLPRVAWPAAAALAACALLVIGVRLPGRAPPVSASLPATKVAVVRVNLSADVSVQDAKIRVTLPDGLVFWSDGQELAQRSFEWTQSLNAGDNEIPIAVRGERPGRYRMTVTANVGGQTIDDVVVLEVTNG